MPARRVSRAASGRLVLVALVAALVAFALSAPTAVAQPTAERLTVERVVIAPTGLLVESTLVLANPNPFPIPLERVDHRILLNGEVVATGTSATGQVLPANGELALPLLTVMGPEGARLAAGLALAGEPIVVTVEAVAHVGAAPITVEVAAERSVTLDPQAVLRRALGI